jgi:hypothetical protein
MNGFLCVKFNTDFKGDIFIHICPVHLTFFQPVGSLVHVRHIHVSVGSQYSSILFHILLPLWSFVCPSLPFLQECWNVYVMLHIFITIYKINFNRAHEVEKLQFMYLEKRCDNIRAQYVKIFL